LEHNYPINAFADFLGAIDKIFSSIHSCGCPLQIRHKAMHKNLTVFSISIRHPFGGCNYVELRLPNKPLLASV
jgi:glycine cleavage system regulatory protein